MSTQLNTVNDWYKKFYRGEGRAAALAVQKADAPIISSTSGMDGPIYGEMAFTQFNNRANLWNALPKREYKRTGWRIRTARGVTIGSGGVAEGGAIPDTVKSTVVKVNATPKQAVLHFEISTVADLLEGDDRYTFEEERKAAAEDHIVDIDKQMLVDVDTLASNNFESIDRVCSNNSEASDGTISLDTGDADIYGLDRDSVTTYDAYVDHNSGTDRDLTTAMIRTAIATIDENSGKRPNVIITGYDQYENILGLYESQARYMTDSRVSVGVNGVQTNTGQDVGITVHSVYGIPLLVDQNVPKDTGSRVYFLNTETVFVGVSLPTQYSESDKYLELGSLKKEGMYLTIGELICTQFSANGKIRDLN